MNGGHWENYIVVTDLPDGSRGSVWQSIAGRYIGESRTPTPVAAGDADGGWNTSNFPINHLKPYRFSVWMKRVSGTGLNYLGVGLNHVRNMGSDTTTPNSNPYFWSGALPAGKWYLVVGYVYPSNYGTGAQLGRGGVYDGVTGQKIATGNDFVWLNSTITSTIQRVYQYYASDQAQSQFAWPRVDEINGSEPSLDQLLAMGAVSARNPITTSNVTTYIADAAIGNAQIGGDIYSSNWSGWGGAGWLLDRGGNFYGNNIYARGDIQASSLKANTAMVQTLNIANNAVIVPVMTEYAAASSNNAYLQDTSTEWTLLSATVTVNIACSALLYIGSNDLLTSNTHAVSAGFGGRGHANFAAGTEISSIRLYINGTLSKRLAVHYVGLTNSKGVGYHLGTYYTGNEYLCSFVDNIVTKIDLVAGENTINIRGWVRMADGDGGARRRSNAYILVMGAQK
jgi:hypothetical protein